ncbi:MAG: LamG domain-containing protein [Magnetovibrio sp.]|nr:LamG domain-containing protein [Magnetovibrio sp.]
MGVLLVQSLISARLKAYGIDYAAQFNGGRLDKTFSTDGGDTWTLSAFVLKDEVAGNYPHIFSADATVNNLIGFNNDDTFRCFDGTSNFYSSGKYRDTAAFAHVVVSSSAGNVTVYINGEDIGIGTTNYTHINYNTLHRIGCASSAVNYLFSGLMADFHFVSDQALIASDFGEFDLVTGNWKAKKYTGTYGSNGFYLDFSNPADLGMDVSGGATWGNSVSLLLHCNGSDTSTTFTDDSLYTYTCTAHGNAQIDTAQSKFGGASMLLDGAGDYVSISDNSVLDFGGEDFTIETWVRFNSIGTYNMFANKWTSSGNQRGWYFQYESAGQLRFGWTTDGLTGQSSTFSWNPTTDTWYHVAVSRKDDDLRCFVDGIQVGSTSTIIAGDTIYNCTQDLWIGSEPVGGQELDGWIDDFRIVKGGAVYTENFDVPTMAHEDPIIANHWTVNGSITQVTSIPNNTGVTLLGTLGTVTHLSDGTGIKYSYNTLDWRNQGGITNLVMHKNTGLYKVKFIQYGDMTFSIYCLFGIMSPNSLNWSSNSGLSGWGKDCIHFDPPWSGTTYISHSKGGINTQGWGGSWPGNPTNGDEIEFLIDTNNDTVTIYNEDGYKVTDAMTMGLLYPLVVACKTRGTQCDVVFDFTASEAAWNAKGTEWTTDRYPKQTGKLSDHWKAVLYTGDGVAIGSGGNPVSGVGFQPDLVWLKSRSSADYHALFDGIRGATKYLASHLTNAETTATESLGSFDADGFTLGSNSTWNANGQSCVSWCASLPNTKTSGWSGSPTITPSKEIYNATLGMSIVKFNRGTGDNITFPHSLGNVPKMVILKPTDAVGGWIVYHVAAGNTHYGILNTTAAFVPNSATWNNTSPTDELITLGTEAFWVANREYVAYIFAETDFCKIFSYTGNGDVDGPFVNLGGSVEWLMLKNSIGANGWYMKDAVRSPYNPTQATLYAHASNAESIGSDVDLVSNGFKVRTTDGGVNGLNTYIGLAFVNPNGPIENPAK